MTLREGVLIIVGVMDRVALWDIDMVEETLCDGVMVAVLELSERLPTVHEVDVEADHLALSDLVIEDEFVGATEMVKERLARLCDVALFVDEMDRVSDHVALLDLVVVLEDEYVGSTVRETLLDWLGDTVYDDVRVADHVSLGDVVVEDVLSGAAEELTAN